MSKEYGFEGRKGEYVKEGYIVGVVMDTLKGGLSFVLNGVNLGVAFEGIPLDKPLAPCVLVDFDSLSVAIDSWAPTFKTETSLSVPSNITLKIKTCNSVTLSWDPVDGASCYQIEIEGLKVLKSTTKTLYVVRGLDPAREYRFRVRAVNKDGEGKWSDFKSEFVQEATFEYCSWKE